jgi:hypothetical protein
MELRNQQACSLNEKRVLPRPSPREGDGDGAAELVERKEC